MYQEMGDKNAVSLLQHILALASSSPTTTLEAFLISHYGSKITVQSLYLAALPVVLEILAVLGDQEAQLAHCLLVVRGVPSDLDGLYDQVSQAHLEGPFLPEDLFRL